MVMVRKKNVSSMKQPLWLEKRLLKDLFIRHKCMRNGVEKREQKPDESFCRFEKRYQCIKCMINAD